MTIDQSLT